MLISEAIYDLIWSRSPKFDPGDEKSLPGMGH